MEKWFVETKRADFDGIAAKYHITPIVARLLRNREVITHDQIEMFLNGGRDSLYDPFLLKDMEKAVGIVFENISAGNKIRIIGDYDIDGICSAYILEKGFHFFMKEAGIVEEKIAELLDIRIPHRVRDGYGLNERLIEEAHQDGVNLIVTCDNGIAAKNQIALAKELGLQVVVTDHHEVPFEENEGVRTFIIPNADAVVNPKQEDCSYPFEGICGGMVAFKLICGMLATKFGKDVLTSGSKNAVSGSGVSDLLDDCYGFAAFATIGDVMELIDENHIIVKYGLPLIQNTKNLGLHALLEQSDLVDKPLLTHHIGFILGPCFNASGRLDTADRVLDMLFAKDKMTAQNCAIEMRALNLERQDLTQEGVDSAIHMVEDEGLMEDSVLVVYLPDVHESLAGIIAGRLRERYCKPTFVLTDGEECVKGSGRSIETYHMFEEMIKVKDCFLKFGGHKMAAGLSIPMGTVDEFRRKINDNCTLTEDDFIEKVMIDIAMPIDYVSAQLIDEMKVLEPYGNGNKKPLFAQKGIKIEKATVMGKKRNVIKFQATSPNGRTFDAIRFCDGDEFMEAYNQSSHMADITYTPTINTFRNISTIQLEIGNIKLY